MKIIEILEEFRKIFANERDKGTAFEKIVKIYLENEPKYREIIEKVWMWTDFPYRDNIGDTGIDLVAKTVYDEYWAIQCKFYAEDHEITKGDVDTFLATSSKYFYVDGEKRKYDYRLFASTTNYYSKNAEETLLDQDPPVGRISLETLLESQIDWKKYSPVQNVIELKDKKTPRNHQNKAIKDVLYGFKKHDRGKLIMACGTGKTFTVANVIKEYNKPTLVLAHNKTLAGQLYSELKEFFPENRVEYFISNFDFYQPEAYIPGRDLYIDKNAKTNYEIEMLRSAAMNSLIEREDVIVVASVASIYGLGNPEQYKEMIFSLRVDQDIDRRELLTFLVDRQYQRNDIEQTKGTFRVRGDVIEIVPGHSESYLIRIELFGDTVERICEVDPLTGHILGSYNTYTIYPAYGYVTKKEQMLKACDTISKELEERLQYFKDETKLLEYERLDQRTRHDVEMLREVGMCPGIENYSRHIDGRKAGQRPYTLIDYFPKDFLLVVDESHVMLPQIRGMYNGDRSRKETLVEYGFRLPSALDNRPLVFEEFEDLIHQAIFVSATPGDYELDKVHHQVVEQIIRPTGLLDPIIEVRPIDGQVDDIIDEIHQRIEKNERVLITTLTKRMAEDLSAYLVELGLKVAYLHSDTKTLERTEILRDLRLGKYDVLVGINLLREGLDLPEVSLVCILDADKEGFLRSERSLIQTIGRAARNSHGKVIMYGDKITDSMQKAIDETARRREIQEKYNKEHGIIPQTIKKEIREAIHGQENVDEAISLVKKGKKAKKKDKETLIKELEKQMKEAAKALDFERAMELRDMMLELQGEV